MKNILNIVAAIVFSTLFYKQSIGLNLLLFTLLTIIVLSIGNYETLKSNKTIFIKILLYLITGVTVFLYSSSLSITANIVAFFTFVGSFSENKASIYIIWLNGIYSAIVSVFAKYFNSFQNEVAAVKTKKINLIYWAKIIIPTSIIIILFTSLYRSGNPLFDDLISDINLDFINFQWILLAGLGYYLFNNISNPIKIEPATQIDLKTDNDLYEDLANKASIEKLNQENQLGLILISLLNLLIIIYLVTDFIYLTKIQQLTAVQLSQQVHSGINSLIASIVLAIIIILYLFRGDLNFFNKNKNLKRLTFTWIFLNLLLSFITAFKNYEYLSTFGLTYKRIGVVIYLTLTIIGLLTTFIKLYKIKNSWYILRQNSQIAFIILILASSINWDEIITNYNMKYAEETDFEYLINLSNNNTFLLRKYADTHQFMNDTVKNKIYYKEKKYINELRKNSWKELVYDNLTIHTN